MSGQRPRSDKPPRLPRSGVWRSGLTFDGLSIAVQWDVDQDRLSGIRRVVIEAQDGQEITARKLHRIKFGRIIDPYREPSAVGKGAPAKPETVGIRSAATRFNLALPSPKGWPPGHYERVVDDYRRALIESPTAPTMALAQKYKVSKPTIRVWLKHAQANGLLPERQAKRGRPRKPREEA